jgi:hypothetical protein
MVLPSELHIHGIDVRFQSDVLKRDIVLAILIADSLPWHNARQLVVR